MTESAEFIRIQTVVASPPLVPELRLHLATEITPLWQATEDQFAAAGMPPPFWAFAWAGGQALARHLLDHADLVAGRSVVDFAAGCGLAAIAAARAGAAAVTAIEIDRFAADAIQLNAALNGVSVMVLLENRVGQPLPGAEVILAGDVCYERPMAAQVVRWLAGLAAGGALVLMGDPGRTYLPLVGLEPVGQYRVPTSLDLEDREFRDATVWRVTPDARPA